VVTPPGATLAASDVTMPDVASYRFTVTYTDNVAVDVSTIDSADVVVTGPNGYRSVASLVSVDVAGNGTPRVATYSVNAPGGVWTQADNGQYTVTMLGNAVGDTEGAFVAVRDLGAFNVAVPRVIYAANMDSNPGWTLEGLWQYGAPKYTVSSAPKAGFTGANILGYNLSGNYGDRLAATYATTPLINCAGSSQLTLKFRRWLRLRSGDHVGRAHPFFLLSVDEPLQLARRKAVFIDVHALEQALDHRQLVLRVEDLEALRQARVAMMRAQHAVRESVESAHPHAARIDRQHGAQAQEHLARRLVGEGDGEHLGRRHASAFDEPRNARGEDARLAAARAREDERVLVWQGDCG
jgi:hypothetical protein